MQEIHDIYPPVMVGMDPILVKIAGICGGALVALLLLIWLIRRFWKRSGPRDVTAVPVAIPPLDAALSALASLDVGRPAKAFYYDLNAVLKDYMGAVLGFRAREMTTRELRRALADSPLPMELAKSLVRFQENSDPLRYGPKTVENLRFTQDLARVEAFIREMDACLDPDPGPDEGEAFSPSSRGERP